MKKGIIALGLILLCGFCLFAGQETYRRNSEEVELFYSLRNLTDDLTPDPVFPITGAQLFDLLKHLDKSKLNGYALEQYNSLLLKLEHTVLEKGWGGVNYQFLFTQF